MKDLIKQVALEVADKFVIGADAETISEFATAFLAELIAERMKTQKEYYESVFQDGANRIAELTAELQATRLQMITDFGQYQEAHEKVNELTAQRDAAMNALVSISKIQNRYDCGDWDEIEEARSIADAAIANCNNKEK